MYRIFQDYIGIFSIWFQIFHLLFGILCPINFYLRQQVFFPTIAIFTLGSNNLHNIAIHTCRFSRNVKRKALSSHNYIY
jgi:hypothetical protein